jgi:hypothetical protein
MRRQRKREDRQTREREMVEEKQPSRPSKVKKGEKNEKLMKCARNVIVGSFVVSVVLKQMKEGKECFKCDIVDICG